MWWTGPWTITLLSELCGDLQPRHRHLEGRTIPAYLFTHPPHQCLQHWSSGGQALPMWILQGGWLVDIFHFIFIFLTGLHPKSKSESNKWRGNVSVTEISLHRVFFPITAGRHEIITKEILELDPTDNMWTVVERRAAMPDSYDVCLVANLNPRDLYTA